MPAVDAAGWDDVAARLPAGWRPDAVALWLPAGGIPTGVWAAPVPVVGLVADWHRHWHAYRRLLPACDRATRRSPTPRGRGGWARPGRR